MPAGPKAVGPLGLRFRYAPVRLDRGRADAGWAEGGWTVGHFTPGNCAGVRNACSSGFWRRSALLLGAVSTFWTALAVSYGALLALGYKSFPRHGHVVCCHVWYSGLVVLLTHEFIFSERFCLPRWLCWRLALFGRLLCFVRLTALPPLGCCPLRVRFRSVRRLPLRPPLCFELSLRCRGAAAALAVALRDFRRAAVELALRSPLHFEIFAALQWSWRCARRCTSSRSLRCRGAAAALARAASGFFIAPPLASVLPRWALVRCALPPQFFPCGF